MTPTTEELLRDLRACRCIYKSQKDEILYETGKCIHQRAIKEIEALAARVALLEERG